MIELLLRTHLAERIAIRALAPDERLHAPHLIDIEITQALRRLVMLRDITALRARQALDDLAEFVIERSEHQNLLSRVWELRDSVTAYDGIYVALAEALDAPLLTCDSKLGRSHGHTAKIEVVA